MLLHQISYGRHETEENTEWRHLLETVGNRVILGCFGETVLCSFDTVCNYLTEKIVNMV